MEVVTFADPNAVRACGVRCTAFWQRAVSIKSQREMTFSFYIQMRNEHRTTENKIAKDFTLHSTRVARLPSVWLRDFGKVSSTIHLQKIKATASAPIWFLQLIRSTLIPMMRRHACELFETLTSEPIRGSRFPCSLQKSTDDNNFLLRESFSKRKYFSSLNYDLSWLHNS